MTPPALHEEEEDLDDLDNLIDEFSPSEPVAQAKPTRAVPAPAPPHAAAAADPFPDPDDAALDDPDDPELDDDFANEFQQSMAQFMGQLGGGGGGGDDDEAREFQQMMQDLLKGDLGGAGGVGGGDLDPAALLAALSGNAAPAPAAVAKGKGKKPVASAQAGPSSATAPASFQDTIKQTMSKMRDSGSTVDAEAEARAANSADPLAAMMAQMAGLGDLGDMGGADGLQGMLDEMMDQLMSRDLLYTPLKELSDKYPAYLKENEATLSAEDTARFKKQQGVVAAIVAKFDEPGADADEATLSDDEKAKRKQRQLDVAELVKEMNDCGAPPPEIMGEMPEGMELGPDGVPKLPTDCTIS